MAASRSNPMDSIFQILSIPDSLTESLQDWGNNKQLAEIIGSIDSKDHLEELKVRIHNLTLTSVRQKDLQHSTKTAVLAAIFPMVILALLAAGLLAGWKICDAWITAKATAW